MHFNPPPNWPAPPHGWVPSAAWQPDPSWGPAPDGWAFWVMDPLTNPRFMAGDDDEPANHVDVVARNSWGVQPHWNREARQGAGLVTDEAATPATLSAGSTEPRPVAPEPDGSAPRIPLFGARRQARQLGEQVSHYEAEIRTLQIQCSAQEEQLRRLGVLGVAELEHRRTTLEQEIAERRLGAELELQNLREASEQELAGHREQSRVLATQCDALREQIVITEDTALLQEVGIYTYSHPLDDAVAYQSELARLRDQIKTAVRTDGGAVSGATNWTVNGSQAQGRTMIRENSKLMLRAYNAEADNLVRSLKPYKVTSARDRLHKVVATIERLGKTMNIRISRSYHQLRIRELELTADYLEKVAEEKERERDERARLREEKKVQQEIDRERARLDKEQQHYQNALTALVANGDIEGAERLRSRLAEIATAIQDVNYRAANVRAGYVYVISNLGSFGEGMIKIGMTRRLEPMDRVRELSDASVPFNFDVHAVFFSDDAVGIEAQMHARLAAVRVNHVNHRREFFYVSPAEAKQHLLDLTGDLLHYEETAEALEFRQSLHSSPA